MKLKSIVSIFFAALLIAACSTGNSENNKEEKTDKELSSQITFESFSIDRIAQFAEPQNEVPAEGDIYMRLTIGGMLPASINGEVPEALRDSLIRYIGLEKNEKGQIIPKTLENTELTDLPADKTNACSFENAVLSIALLTPKVVVWAAFKSIYFCNAVHGGYSTTYLNYSLILNKILTYKDLFKQGYEKELTRMVRAYLDSNYKDTLYVNLSDVELSDNFRITENGINFYYGIYEIAPYSAGEIEVKIYDYQLEELLSETGKALFNNQGYI